MDDLALIRQITTYLHKPEIRTKIDRLSSDPVEVLLSDIAQHIEQEKALFALVATLVVRE